MMQEPIDVFYDGGCPVCQIEVDLYRKFDDGKSIHWIDITHLTDDQLPVAKDRETLLNRFHVRGPDGKWFIAVDAFARIWRQLPGFRRFAFLFEVPGLRHLAEIGYRWFLKWQRWHRTHRRPERS